MNMIKIAKVSILASIFCAGLCQADAATGLATGKRQHKPVTVSAPIDKATPGVKGATVGGQAATNKARAGYRLCPDGTMIHPGEKCPEKAKAASK